MRRTHSDVRLFLRSVRHPSRARAHSLAATLCAALDVATLREAMRILVGRALSHPADHLLRTIVERCDFEGATTHAVASDVGLSPRQFFRYRAEAVDALACEIDRVLAKASSATDDYATRLAVAASALDPEAAFALVAGRYGDREPYALRVAHHYAEIDGGAPQSPLDRLARAEAAFLLGDYAAFETRLAAFERAVATCGAPTGTAIEYHRLRLEDACRRGAGDEAERILKHLLAETGPGPRARFVRALARARLGCRTGDGPVAARALDELVQCTPETPEDAARVALAHAELAFVRGDDAGAAGFARCAAALAPCSPDVAPAAHALAGRAALCGDFAWTPPARVRATHWSATVLLATRARHALRAGNLERARALASAATAAAARHASPGALAFALATEAAIAETVGAPARAARLRLRAFAAFAASHDAVVARDAFTWHGMPTRDLGAAVVDDAFASELWAFKERAFPAYRSAEHVAMRSTNVAGLRLRAKLATRQDAATAGALHTAALTALAAMRRCGIDPSAALRLGRHSLGSHWFPSAALLPLGAREEYKRRFMIVTEAFYTAIERHARDGTCPVCAKRSGRRTA